MNTVFAVLMIVTSHGALGDTGKHTGLWFEELATPYYALRDAGAKVEIVSIEGGVVPIDPGSRKPEGQNEPSVDRFLKDPEAMAQITHSRPLSAVNVADYDAVFLPGGHGTMWDLPASTDLARQLTAAWAAGKVLAAVCHGPAGLVNVVDTDGKPLVAGRRVSAFTDSEETAMGLTNVVPFLLETRLRSLGATIVSGPDFKPQAVRDGRLVTGQNPASSEAVAHLTLEALRAQ